MAVEPSRPQAEHIRSHDVITRIVEAKASDAWQLLRDVIQSRPETKLPLPPPQDPTRRLS